MRARDERRETGDGRGRETQDAKSSLAYISDCHVIPEETLAKLAGTSVEPAYDGDEL